MKRLFIATIALFIIAGLTFWVISNDPEINTGALKSLTRVSELKKHLPAAEAGDAKAQYLVGQIYAQGTGVKKDPKQAYEWYTKSANQGYGASRYEIGKMFADGKPVRQNYYTAAKWYRLAATFNNNAKAQFRLGELYFNGRGVEHDYGKAIAYYTKAAGQGHAAAQYLLGAIYQEGWGVPKDLITAYMWQKLALPHRDEAMAVHKKYDPRKKLAVLKDKMNNYQLEEAERRLAELRKPR